MSVGPAYKSFVAGECTPELARQTIRGDFLILLRHCMYGAIQNKQTFYRVGFQKYLHTLRQFAKSMDIVITAEKESAAKYYYNRQLIVQMTMTPQKCENDPDSPFYVSVPLYKEPGDEVQTDILQLQPEQWKINYNMRYLVVIVDPFSRFVWSCPVESLQAIKVQSAFGTALMRRGESSQMYNFIRETVQRVVVDGGSEFKDVFPESLKLYFPNADLIVSSAKNRTGNRPTGNGPIEAAIRLLRRVIRDYSLAIHPNFLRVENDKQHYGLQKILYGYNHTFQIVLHNKSPAQVMEEMMTPKLHGKLKETIAYVENRRNDKIMLKQKNMSLLGENQITRDRNGSMGYRIYKPPGQFAKEVDIKVSLKVYVVDKLNPTHPQFVDLIEYGNGTETLKNVLWNTLVLVKTPVENGPPSILQHFTTTIADWGFMKPPPEEISRPFRVTRNIIEAIAGEPDEQKRRRHAELITEPLGRKRRRNEDRGARFRGAYIE